MMKSIEVKHESFNEPFPALEVVSGRLDSYGPGHMIDTLNWKDFGYKPSVRFNIAYSDREILLKYYIREEYLKAEKTETNQMVCEDSCVEFFVSPADDGIYYNFEFNAIGTCLLGSGTCRQDSSRAPVEIVSKIRKKTSKGIRPIKEVRGDQVWEITVAVPFEAFFRHDIGNLRGKKFRANFYKCGDKLSIPHYVTWNPVGTPQPDYHQPGFFGILNFV